MAAQYNDDAMADLFSCFHIENSAGLLKCNGTEHLVKKRKKPQPSMVFFFMDDIYCFCILIVRFKVN